MEEYSYIYTSCGRDEVPAKRGRGRGRGIPPSRPPDNIPSRPGSSQTDQRSTGRARGRIASAIPVISLCSSDEEESACSTEKSRDYASSTEPSTSQSEEERLGQKATLEDVKLHQESPSPNVSIFVKRPDIGKKGRPIRVVSNCFPIDFPTGYVYHYDVEVTDNNQRKASAGPEIKKYRCLNTKKNRDVIAFMLKNNPAFKGYHGAYDGRKNLLTREKIRVNLPFTCSVMLPYENCDSRDPKYDSFKAKIISLVSRINLESIRDFYHRKSSYLPQDAIMAIETILRHNPCLHLSPIGRSFFYPPDVGSLTPFGGGLEIWFGYHQAIRLSQWRPTVNLDVSSTVFWKSGPVLNFIADYMEMSVRDLRTIRYMRRTDVKRLSKKLKQKQISVTHSSYGRKYRIIRLREIAANEEYIELVDKGKKIRKTVSQYFKDTYKRDLQYGNLPCLQVQPEKKNVFMPIELCEFVPGQHYKGELTPEQKSKMIEFTTKPPDERFRKIENIVDRADFSRDSAVRGFELEISDRPLKADARVLNPPSLLYKDRYDSDKPVLPRDGSWNVRDSHFFQGAEISSWTLLSFQADRNLEEFADVLVTTGRNLGLQIGQPSDILNIPDIDCDKEKLFRHLKKRGSKLAVIVIPNLDESARKRFYAEVKNAAEISIGLITQCIKAERLRDMTGRRGPQIASNLCLKINAKLGGENHSLFERDIPSILCKPVIIIGADVNHPPPTQLNQPSIAACVGSLDSFGKRFAVSIRAQVNSREQKRKVEEICDLEDMVRDLLLAFYRHVRHKPRKIIFYRDGVSEGELVTVKNKELVSIRRACCRLQKGYEPGITVIVVQKRHHVRFRPYNPKEGSGRMNNLPPGTVIDTEVTHPVNFDFFLCSQYCFQGTSRPSHYLVVEDDNDFSADELQKLTFHLCHMYVRCTKSISIPAPVAYADLVAYRARKHLESKKGEDTGSSSDFFSYRLTQDDIDAITVVEGLKDSMYFV